MTVLFNHNQKREAAKWGTGGEEMKENAINEKKPEETLAFGSPEDYAHLSLDERKKLTQEMIGKHKGTLRGAMRVK